MSALDNHPLLERFSQLPHVAAGTKRTRRGFGAQIVLAPWPISDDLADLSSSEHVRALCLEPCVVMRG